MNRNKLSLLAKYDDMCRQSNSLIKSDKEFKDILLKCEFNRTKWLECKQELSKLKTKNVQLEADNGDLRQKISRLRYAYSEEVRKFDEKSKECVSLRYVLDSIRECIKEDSSSNSSRCLNYGSSSNNSRNLDSLLSLLSSNELLKQFSDNSRKQSNTSAQLELENDDDELIFDKTEDSINVSKVGFNERAIESRQTYLVHNKASPDSDKTKTMKTDSNPNSDSDNCRRVNSTSNQDSPVSSYTFSEDYYVNEELSNAPQSSDDLMSDDELSNDTKVIGTTTNVCTPKNISSPTISKCATIQRGLHSCNSIKSTRRVKLDLDRLDKRPHSLQLKKFFKSIVCVPCGKSINFCSKCVVCVDCRTVAHVHCEKDLSLPCIPHYTPRGLSRSGTHCHMLMIGDFISPDTRPFVPSLLVHCCNEIERRGLDEQGIYRKCGSGRDVRELKSKFLYSKTGPPNISKVDVHVLCGVVKLFLRDLDDPLITRILWNDFARATDVINSDKTEELLKKTIEQLPDANRDSMAFLILHLQRVANNSSANRMAITSLAKIFGPTAVGYSVANPPLTSIVAENGKQVQIMISLLEIDSTFWEDKLRNPEINETPLRGLNTPKRIQEVKFVPNSQNANSPYSCRSGSSSVYVTPRSMPKVIRYAPSKRNRLFSDLIY